MLNAVRGTTTAQRVRRLIAGIVATTLLGYFMLQGVDFAGMLVYVRGADPRWLGACAVCVVFADLVRALRWGSLLGPAYGVPIGVRFRSVLVGSAGNHMFPLRLGEVLRIHTLSRRSGVPFATALTTLVIERVFDVVGILLIFGCCLLFLPGVRGLDPGLETAIQILTALIVLFIAAVALVLAYREQAGVWIERRLSRYARGRLVTILYELMEGLRSLRSGRQMAMTMVYTIVMWSIFGLSFAFGLLSLDLAGGGGGELIARAALVVVFVSVFTMIPAAIGLLGTFQAGCIVALAAFDVSKSHALGFSVVVHAVQFATDVLVGLGIFVVAVWIIERYNRPDTMTNSVTRQAMQEPV